MGAFSDVKDRVVERLALSYLNTGLLVPYGRATDLKIDSTAKTVQIEVELKGEPTPVKIEIVDYEIMRKGDRFFVKVSEVHTSREWLTALAATQLCKEQFELPSEMGRLLIRAL